MDAVKVWTFDDVKWMLEENQGNEKRMRDLSSFCFSIGKFDTLCDKVLLLTRGPHHKNSTIHEAYSSAKKRFQAGHSRKFTVYDVRCVCHSLHSYQDHFHFFI